MGGLQDQTQWAPRSFTGKDSPGEKLAEASAGTPRGFSDWSCSGPASRYWCALAGWG